MRFIVVVLILIMSVNAASKEHQLQYYSENFSDKSTSESTHLQALYFEALYQHINVLPTSYLNVAVQALAPLANNSAELYTEVQKEKLHISDFNIDFYSESMALGVGRQTLSFDWLQGNFDGALLYGLINQLGVKAFYFDRYSLLTPSFATQKESLGLLGIDARLSDERTYDCNVYYYHEDAGTLDGIYQTLGMGAKWQNTLFSFGLQGVYQASSIYGDEAVAKVYSNYFISDQSALELSYSYTSDGGINHLFDYGDSRINSFVLGNLCYLPKSRTTSLTYKYQNAEIDIHSGLGYANADTLKVLQVDGGAIWNITHSLSVSANLLLQDRQSGDSISDFVFANSTLAWQF